MYLGIFFMLISLYGLIQYVIFFSESVVLVGIFFTNAGFPTYLTGPALYIYMRSILNDDGRLKRHDVWHFIPMLIYLAGTIPYMFSPWEFKLEVAKEIVERAALMVPFYTDLIPIYNYVPAWAVYLSRPLLILGYLLWSAGSLIRFSRGQNDLTVFRKQRFMLKWLITLLCFLLILVLSHSLQIIETFKEWNISVFTTLNLLQVISALGLGGLLLSPFFFPHILYGLPRIPNAVVPDENEINAEEPEPVKPKVSNDKFEANYIDLISSKIEQCMSELKPYLQNDFNLAQLSPMINIPAHHLAWYFREVRQLSFTDFRNRWRVEHAKNLILEGKSADLTLEAIGFLSGFSSRNTFLNAFKKAEGISPNSFQTQVKNSKNI